MKYNLRSKAQIVFVRYREKSKFVDIFPDEYLIFDFLHMSRELKNDLIEAFSDSMNRHEETSHNKDGVFVG